MLFEFVLISFIFISLILIVAAVVLALTGSPASSGKLLGGLGLAWVAYVLLVMGVDFASPQTLVARPNPLCFDDMCFSVTAVRRSPTLGPPGHVAKADGVFYIVSIEVSNRGRGRAQAEKGILPRLWATGRFYDISLRGQAAYEAEFGKAADLSSRLAAGETITTTKVFDVPTTHGVPLGFVIDHGLTPNKLVIGESELFHGPRMIPIP